MGRAIVVVILVITTSCRSGASGSTAPPSATTRPPVPSLSAALRRLPASGIVIVASGYQEASPRPALPAGRRLPYRLSEFRRDAGWEGQPAVNVPQYVLAASRGNHLRDVRVFFGTQEPSDREMARAQAELGTLSWR